MNKINASVALISANVFHACARGMGKAGQGQKTGSCTKGGPGRKRSFSFSQPIGSGAIDFVAFLMPFPVDEYGSLVPPGYNPWITNE